MSRKAGVKKKTYASLKVKIRNISTAILKKIKVLTGGVQIHIFLLK